MSVVDKVRGQLAFYAEDEYREFARKITPSKRPFLGVRIPLIRKVANTVPRKDYEELLMAKPVALEEVLVRGMIICKLPYDEMLKWFDSQVLYIDDWSTCDVFCAGLRRVVRGHLDEFLESKVKGLVIDPREFAVRVGIVILKTSYVKQKYLEPIFEVVEDLALRDEYYVKMAIAWLIAECFIKYPDETLEYLKVTKLSKWTFNKTISKICDSYRVSGEMKKMLRGIRK